MSLQIYDRFCQGRQSRTWRGLVIDDVPAACRATGMALSALGGQITTAANGAEAIEIVRLTREAGLDFDIVFTDIEMPIMDGLETAAVLRSQGFSGPIIAISGSERFGIVDLAHAAGCDHFIAKPATLEKLASIVLQHCPQENSNVPLAHV